MRVFAAFLSVAIVVGGGAPAADVWDIGADNDNTAGTDNEMTHGLLQTHDLGVQAGPTEDRDFYAVAARPRSSYEAFLDGQTGGINLSPFAFRRVDLDGATPLQDAVPAEGFELTLSLAWENTTASTDPDFIVVGPASCGLSCTTNDQYRMRFYETTISVPRFNNAGSQITILLIQNAGATTAAGTIYFWSTAGALLASTTFSVPSKGLHVLNTSTVPGATSGSMTISNTARFGNLAVKSVALEPSTGFSFDTPGLYKPY